MKEMGGYLELDTYRMPMLHENAINLNCGRNALAYLLVARNIKKILIPYFLCESVSSVCEKYDVEVRYYSISKQFMPNNIQLASDEWLYVVNYYGQLSDMHILNLKKNYQRVIIDNAHAYFNLPLQGVDTIYTCRKYFGVSDGAFVYTDAIYKDELEIDESYERMRFLLGRFERTASEFYSEYVINNELFEKEPIKKMSKLTQNLLHGIDYRFVCEKRTENFWYLHDKLNVMNRLKLIVPNGAFMYPLYIDDGASVRKKLQEKKIYIPLLWPDVFDICDKNMLEYDMAENILPLPVDQRYDLKDMEYLVNELMSVVKYV